MNYTKAQRADLRKAFTVARSTLADTSFGKKEYICHTLEFAHTDRLITKKQIDIAKALIMYRMGGGKYLAFGTWLNATTWVTYEMYQRDRLENEGRKMQETRKAWLDSLIEEFSK